MQVYSKLVDGVHNGGETPGDWISGFSHWQVIRTNKIDV